MKASRTSFCPFRPVGSQICFPVSCHAQSTHHPSASEKAKSKTKPSARRPPHETIEKPPSPPHLPGRTVPLVSTCLSSDAVLTGICTPTTGATTTQAVKTTIILALAWDSLQRVSKQHCFVPAKRRDNPTGTECCSFAARRLLLLSGWWILRGRGRGRGWEEGRWHCKEVEKGEWADNLIVVVVVVVGRGGGGGRS